ncbi:hypothetical protein Taro_002859 [Colocasia esculenta]|uniref:BED-type domain-containing protein n=1 Tax=Colocasia esculenta TaxID=4460 RepID=A0A843TFB8_COLES|nr:hypothetical protein [Colocasia esculenta]
MSETRATVLVDAATGSDALLRRADDLMCSLLRSGFKLLPLQNRVSPCSRQRRLRQAILRPKEGFSGLEMFFKIGLSKRRWPNHKKAPMVALVLVPEPSRGGGVRVVAWPATFCQLCGVASLALPESRVVRHGAVVRSCDASGSPNYEIGDFLLVAIANTTCIPLRVLRLVGGDAGFRSLLGHGCQESGLRILFRQGCQDPLIYLNINAGQIGPIRFGAGPMRDPHGCAEPAADRANRSDSIRPDPIRRIRHNPIHPTPLKSTDALRIGTMAPKKGNSENIGWQHGTALGSRHNYKCNYCSYTGQGGGVSRLKKHLAGGRLAGYHDVQGCKSVPVEVKRLMIEHLKGVRAEMQRKRADREMQERIISGKQRDEDDDDEPQIHAEYVPDVPE